MVVSYISENSYIENSVYQISTSIHKKSLILYFLKINLTQSLKNHTNELLRLRMTEKLAIERLLIKAWLLQNIFECFSYNIKVNLRCTQGIITIIGYNPMNPHIQSRFHLVIPYILPLYQLNQFLESEITHNKVHMTGTWCYAIGKHAQYSLV